MSSAYWCHQCHRTVRLRLRLRSRLGSGVREGEGEGGGEEDEDMVCPICNGGFVEEMDRGERERQLPPSHHLLGSMSNLLGHFEGRRRHGRDRMAFNPMIILRSNPNNGGGGGEESNSNSNRNSHIEVYFDNGSGIGLRRLPAHLTDYFMGFGLDRLIEQLAHNDGASCGPLPASRSAVEAMPTVEIAQKHLGYDLHCAICKDPFEIGGHAREMPCKHIYHSDCIMPWLSHRNSCPVCRHEMPTERDHNPPSSTEEEGREIGLTIWRLPGGGFAVGRFSGGRNGVSVINNTNADAATSVTGTTTRRESSSSGRNSGDGGENQGSRRNPFSFLWPFRSSNSNSEPQNTQANTSPSSSSDQNSRRRVGWPFEDGIGPSGWFN